MKHPIGTHCRLKTPTDWRTEDHEIVLQAHREGEAVIYHGPQLDVGEKRARHIRELLTKLTAYPAHPTAIALAADRKGFRSQTTQTGLHEWRIVLKTGPYTKDWLSKFVY